MLYCTSIVCRWWRKAHEYFDRVGEKLCLGFDGGWGHRGHWSHMGVCNMMLLLLDRAHELHGKIVRFAARMKSRWHKGKEVFKGNWTFSSASMERSMVDELLDWALSNDCLRIIFALCGDADAKAQKVIREKTDKLEALIDGGHCGKNLEGTLKKGFGSKKKYECPIPLTCVAY